MTAMRSHVCAATPTLCVMITWATPSSSRSLSSRLRICAWMVTSSAVVGSSAMSSGDPQARAIAMHTRCLMPPLN